MRPGPSEDMLNSDNPFIRQFLSGESQGPLDHGLKPGHAPDAKIEAMGACGGRGGRAERGDGVDRDGGRGPLSRSTPVDAASARAPVTALLMLLAGCRDRRAHSGRDAELAEAPAQGRRRPGVRARTAPRALDLEAAGGCAALRAGRGSHRRGGVGHDDRSTTFPGSAWAAAPSSPNRSGTVREVGAAGSSSLAGLVGGACDRARGGRRRIARGAAARREPRRGRSSEQGAARDAVEAAIGALDRSADPRSALIAAYAAMERTLAEHGIARSRAEAPREYLQRVLVAPAATER